VLVNAFNEYRLAAAAFNNAVRALPSNTTVTPVVEEATRLNMRVQDYFTRFDASRATSDGEHTLAEAIFSHRPHSTSRLLDVLNNKFDVSVPNQLNFQTSTTDIMEKIVDLHHDLMFFIIAIVVFVS
jgi:hypothetical protein